MEIGLFNVIQNSISGQRSKLFWFRKKRHDPGMKLFNISSTSKIDLGPPPCRLKSALSGYSIISHELQKLPPPFLMWLTYGWHFLTACKVWQLLEIVHLKAGNCVKMWVRMLKNVGFFFQTFKFFKDFQFLKNSPNSFWFSIMRNTIGLIKS